MSPELDVTWLHGFRATATSGQYRGSRIEVEAKTPELVLFTIEGTPTGCSRSVAWEASATDHEGVIEWLEEFGLLHQAELYASTR